MKNNFVRLVLSIVIAFGLWLYVVTVVSPESEASYYDVPVVFDGVSLLDERELMITAGKDATMNLKLSGNRTDLNKLDKTNITILADLSQIREPGEHKVKCTVSFPSNAGIIEVLEKDPQYITVKVSERARKDVPVRLFTEGAVPEGFIADIENAALSHATVTVSGPREVVDQIEYAAITVDLNGQVETMVETYRHTLCSADGNPVEDVSAITVNVSDIRMTLRVYQIKEIPVVIQVIPGGGMTSADVTVIPSHSSILVSGSEAALSGLDKIELVVDLGLLTDSQVLDFPIELPENVTNESGISVVHVNVKIPEMTTATVTVLAENFILQNVPENLDVVIRKEQLVVKIQGRENKLNEITAENIIVSIDFANAVPGAEYYTCTIEIVGVSDVGVVYDEAYRILVLITEKS